MRDDGGGTDMEAVLREALELGEQERWDEMATLLAETLDREEDDPYLLCWLGVAENELDNEGAAYEAFRRCIELDPTDPHILALAGAGLAQFDDPDAEATLRAAALSAPDLPLARLNYGAYLSRAGLHDEALEQLSAARDLLPDDPVVRARAGRRPRAAGGARGWALELEEALALAPDDSWTRLLLGLVLLELDRGEEAAEELVRAAQEREHDAEAMLIGCPRSRRAAAGRTRPKTCWSESEYAAEGADIKLIQETESAVHAGAEAAARMLRGSLAPSSLRERLQQPL